jgi:hypothetical protein
LKTLRPANCFKPEQCPVGCLRTPYPSEGEGEGEDSLSDAAGVLLGEADGEDSLLAFFVVELDEEELLSEAFFLAGLALVDAVVLLFLVVEVPVVFLAVVDVAVVDFLVVAAGADDSSLWAQATINPTATKTAVKGNANFFIGMTSV